MKKQAEAEAAARAAQYSGGGESGYSGGGGYSSYQAPTYDPGAFKTQLVGYLNKGGHSGNSSSTSSAPATYGFSDKQLKELYPALYE